MKKLVFAALLAASPAVAQTAPPAPPAPVWDAAPWLADLAQYRDALLTKYANLEWLTEERGLPIDRALDQAKAAMARAGSDAEARRLLDRMTAQIGDGHVKLRWPAGAAASGPAGPKPANCGALGYNGRSARAGTAAALPGYRKLEGAPFPAGLVENGGTRIGVMRIGVFDPHGYPALCEAAFAAITLPAGAGCDDSCEDQVLTRSYRAMTSGLADTLKRLKAEGAQVLLLDISDNGGGSEWAEAAARMLSARTLSSAKTGFVRGAHWAKIWSGTAERLRGHAAKAKGAERAQLLAWAAEAEAAAREASKPCDPATGCTRIARAGTATGLVGSAPAGAFDGKPWANDVFTIAQHPYVQGAWDGPVILLVDNETWSAAEEVAAMLADNKAALVMGARTGGAGCGYSWGGTPTKLAYSGATLEVPDCVRYRADGSNEVRGVIPEVLTGVRANDGPKLRAELTAAKLGEAIARAQALYAAQR
ncbi:S41 family peptidase [Sphingomonas soli]|uniref:S41 family peptidase n=1 Tax=Sphingomonas soli TaxID=266127 RepID=UPI000833B6D3|nr:S41 family peptidase [Sphingomonas soli]